MQIEHPEIGHIMNTGYPSDYKEPEPTYCQECGNELEPDEEYEDENHKFLCKECLLFLHKKSNW